MASYIGQCWSAIMGLAFIPIYIRYLGMEAYGLVGVFAIIQAWLVLLDIGITPTLNREMARFTAGAHSAQSIRDLLKSAEMICFGLATAIALTVWAASGYLASDWLKIEKLPTSTVAQAIAIIALVVSLRFVEGIYRGSLFGLQRLVWYSGASALLATIRHAGAVAVLAYLSPTIQAFFVWQGLVSLMSTALFCVAVHRALPAAPSNPKFSREAVAEVWRFAGGIIGITFLALLLTQVDKVLLSRLLTLEHFGYYTLAATIVGVVYQLVAPITQAMYPRMVELVTRQDHPQLVAVYHQGAQLVTILTAPAAFLLSFFAIGVVFMWSGDIVLAEKTGPILSVMVIGTFLHGLMHLPYQLQLAYGWTGLAVKSNIVAVLILTPAILWVAPRYGGLGAAAVWVILNVGYTFVGIQFMHRRLLVGQRWSWYFADVTWPVMGVLGVMVGASSFKPQDYRSRFDWFIFLSGVGVAALITAVTLANVVRPKVARGVALTVRKFAASRRDH